MSRWLLWSTVSVERHIRPPERIRRLTELTTLHFGPPLRILRDPSSSPGIRYGLLRLANLLFGRRGRSVLFFDFDIPVERGRFILSRRPCEGALDRTYCSGSFCSLSCLKAGSNIAMPGQRLADGSQKWIGIR